jgi:hypothetical protein
VDSPQAYAAVLVTLLPPSAKLLQSVAGSSVFAAQQLDTAAQASWLAVWMNRVVIRSFVFHTFLHCTLQGFCVQACPL